MPKVAFSPAQVAFLQESTARVNMCDGSVRSGKTIVTGFRFLIFVALAQKMSGALVIAGRTRDSAWRNVIQPMQDPALFGELAKQVVGVYGAPTVKILGRTVHVLGGHDTSSELSLRGLTVAGCLLDEVTTIHVNFFKQMLARMSVSGAQMFATTNPGSPSHWLKVDYLDRIGSKKNPLKSWKYFKFLLSDNPGNSRKYVRDLKDEYTGLWYKRFIEGLWVAAEGAIFDFWDPDEFVVPWATLPNITRLFGIGVDYGTTHATGVIMLGLGDDDKLYYVDEWRYEADGKSNRLNDDTMARRLKAWLDEPHLPPHCDQSLVPEWTVVDPAAGSFKVMLSDRGFENVIDADNTVLYGIRLLSSMLTSKKLYVSDRCEGMIGEMPNYSWDAKSVALGIDKPLKVADDSIDPARYILVTTESIWHDLVA